MKIRTLIVDDEPLARRRILSLLQSDADFEVLGESGNGKDAVEKITELKPDLVFLDVQMPKLDGFGVLEAVAQTHLPAIVFVTAYDQYAVKAFDAHAVDYLLKPFKQERFMDAVLRVKSQVQGTPANGNGNGEENQKLLSLLRHVNTDSDRLVVRSSAPPRSNGLKPPLITSSSTRNSASSPFAKKSVRSKKRFPQASSCASIAR
jgi:two-component system LytT family response regulator